MFASMWNTIRWICGGLVERKGRTNRSNYFYSPTYRDSYHYNNIFLDYTEAGTVYCLAVALKKADANKYVGIIFDRPEMLREVITKGRHAYNQWVTRYSIEVTTSPLPTYNYQDSNKTVENREWANNAQWERIYDNVDGNHDRDTSKIYNIDLNYPVTAVRVVMNKTDYHGHPSIRMGVNVCENTK